MNLQRHFPLRSVALLLILSVALLASRGIQCATACSLRQCAPHTTPACPHTPASSRDTHPPCKQHHSMDASWVLAPKAAVTADFSSSLPATTPLAAFFALALAVVLPAPLDTGRPDLVPIAQLRI